MTTRETKTYIPDEHVWVNADKTRAVDMSDPEAAYLHTPGGRSMPFEEAERLGLVKQQQKRDVAPETKKKPQAKKPAAKKPTRKKTPAKGKT